MAIAIIDFPNGKRRVRDLVDGSRLRGLKLDGYRPSKILLEGDLTLKMIKDAMQIVQPITGDVVFDDGFREVSFKEEEGSWEYYQTIKLIGAH